MKQYQMVRSKLRWGGWKTVFTVCSILFPNLSFAWSMSLPAYASTIPVRYIVPDICVNRAIEIGVFTNKDPAFTAKALEKNFDGAREIDFNALETAYKKSLRQLNLALESSQSSIMQYLIKCNKDGEECHFTFFNPKNPSHLKFYCDKPIFQSMMYSTIEKNYEDFQKEIQDPNKDRTDEEIQILKDKVKTAREKIQAEVEKQDLKLHQIKQNIKNESVMPEGFEFILGKVREEFLNYDNRHKILSELRRYYSTVRMMNQFKNCCSVSYTTTLPGYGLLPEYKTAASYAIKAGNDLEKQLKDNQIPLLQFTPYEGATRLLLDAAEEENWKCDLADQLPLNMDPYRRKDFFSFLQEHPFYLRDQHRDKFAEAKEIVRQNPFVEFPKEETTPQIWRSFGDDPEWEAYKQELKYEPLIPPQIGDINGPYPFHADVRPGYAYTDAQVKNPGLFIQDEKERNKEFLKHFIFDPSFSSQYLEILEEEIQDLDEATMEDAKAVKYAELREGYIPFSFGRAAKSMLIRELGMVKKSYAKNNYLKDLQSFQSWSEKVICGPDLLLEQDIDLRTTYCTTSNVDKRMKTYKSLFDAIERSEKQTDPELKEVDIHYLSESSVNQDRSSVYGQQFLKDLNTIIQNINDYCWKTLEKTSQEKKESGDFAAFTGVMEFQTMWGQFRKFVGDDMYGLNLFRKTLEFSENEAVQNCFTKGQVFGSLQDSDLAWKERSKRGEFSLSTLIRPGTGGLQKWMGENIWSGFDAAAELSFFDRYSSPNFQITMEDLQNIETNLEETLHEKLSNLRAADEETKPKKVEEFLRTSVTYETTALIEYALAYPSEQTAKFICKLISDANEAQRVWNMQKDIASNMIFAASMMILPQSGAIIRGLLRTGAARLVGGNTAVMLADLTLLADSIPLVDTLVGLGFGGAIVAGHQLEIWELQNKNDLIDQSAVSGSMDASDAASLHEVNDREIRSHRIHQYVGGAIAFVFATKPLINLSKFAGVLLKEENGFWVAVLRHHLEHVTNHTRTLGPDALKYFGSEKFTEFFLKKAGRDEAFEFLQLLKDSKIKPEKIHEFVVSNWKNELGEIPLFEGAIAKPTFLGKITRPLVLASLPVRHTFNSIYQPIYYRLRIKWLDLTMKFLSMEIKGVKPLGWLYDRLAMERKIANFYNCGIKAGIYTSDDLQKVASKFEFYKYDTLINKFGIYESRLVRVTTEEAKSFFREFSAKQPYLVENPEIAKDFFQKIVNEEIGERLSWKIAMENFKDQLKSAHDMELFVEVIKYSQQEYRGIINEVLNLMLHPTQLKRLFTDFSHSPLAREFGSLGELWKWKEVSGAYVYPLRGKAIQENSTRIFRILKLRDFELNLQIQRDVDDYARAIDVKRADIVQGIKESKEEAWIEGDSIRKRLTRINNDKPEQWFLETDLQGKYEKHLWNMKKWLEQDYRQDLKRFLKNDLKKLTNPSTEQKIDSFARSYSRAITRTNMQRDIVGGCLDPNLPVRKDIQEIYQQYLVWYAVAGTAVGYTVNHAHEVKDREWFDRIGFEILSSFLINRYMLSHLYSSTSGYRGSPLIRDLFFYPGWTVAATMVDAQLYQSMIQSKYNNADRYEAEFMRIIYESSDLRKTIEEHFGEHPELEKKLYARLDKIEESLQQINKADIEGNLSVRDYINLYTKEGLVDGFFSSPGKTLYESSLKEGLINKEEFENTFEPDIFEQYSDTEQSNQQMVGIITDTILSQNMLALPSDNLSYKSYDSARVDNTPGEIVEAMRDEVYQAVRNKGSTIKHYYPDDSWIGKMDNATGDHWDRETTDRAAFHLKFGLGVFPLAAILKNGIIFNATCYGRYLPPKASLALALGGYAVYKTILEYEMFHWRQKKTGH